MTVEQLREEATKLGYAVYDVRKPLISDEEVIQLACAATHTQRSEFTSPTRKHRVVLARYLYIMYARKTRPYSFEKIGRIVNRDHADVMHGNEIMSMELKYFKPWQQEAIRLFNGGIADLEQLKKAA